MTLSKLAQLANVSVSVVSKAFSGRSDISDAMREHVFSVAREYDCFQQFYHARYDKPVIAVIIPEAISKYYIHYIETLKKDIEENGYTMLLSINNFDEQLTGELIRYYTVHSKVDGLILVDSAHHVPAKSETAVISISSSSSLHANVAVVYSIREGLRAAVRHLYELGHRRIAYVGEQLITEKKRLLEEEMACLGLQTRDAWMISSYFRFEEAGRDGAERIFSDPTDRPTAIFGAYGYITQGILAHLADLGLSIPEDVSVVSMDSDPDPLHPTMAIAHISSGIEENCAKAIQLLRERIGEASSQTPCTVTVAASFDPGESICPPKA